MPVPKLTPEHMRIMKDVGDVFIYKTKNLLSFPPAYQKILRDTFRFLGNRYESDETLIAPRTNDTLDVV